MTVRIKFIIFLFYAYHEVVCMLECFWFGCCGIILGCSKGIHLSAVIYIEASHLAC